MKVTVVPAQVTTVEDRIIGNLGFSQMLLMIVPIFSSAGFYVLLPPFMGNAIYKYVIMGILAIICCTLAIRIKGKILAFWLVTILRYNVRPKYYLFNKNTTALRHEYAGVTEMEPSSSVSDTRQTRPARPRLNTPQTAKVLAAIENPAAKFRFETTKKGVLHARLTEIEK